MGGQSSKAAPGDAIEKMQEVARATEELQIGNKDPGEHAQRREQEEAHGDDVTRNLQHFPSFDAFHSFGLDSRTKSKDGTKGEEGGVERKQEDERGNKSGALENLLDGLETGKDSNHPAYHMRRPSRLQLVQADFERAHDAGMRMLEDISDLVTSSSS